METNNYKFIRSLGKGGMGEVFLAFDQLCQRQVALKQIRADLQKFKSMKDRFLREAHIACKLNHPSIIPIFSIHEDQECAFYTMPFVEGETLKQLLKEAPADDPKVAIAPLMRIFLSICQAIAHCHSRGILHRDLKPENIIIGKFGEVMIIDWGLASYIDHKESETEEEIPNLPHLTRPGKVVGTLAYLAPERAQNEPASEQTDLYALGVILYQILTLKLPFKRSDIETFQKIWAFEELPDPIEAAPYRDIPLALCQIVKKCLLPKKEMRYKLVSELIFDVKSFLEGKPEWIVAKTLALHHKEDWEFQENIVLAKHIAITRSAEILEWVNLMISKASFSGNTKIEATIRLGPTSHGVGVLLNIPEAKERRDLMDGYCIWVGSTLQSGLKIFRCNIEVLEVLGVALEPLATHQLRIEKTGSHLRIFIDNSLKAHYVSHIPLAGTHVGLLLRDADLEISHFNVFIGSQNVTVSCLAIPDAFLAIKDYSKALAEYRKISTSFPGRTEGREAIFRAGVTLLEAGVASKKLKDQQQLLSTALEEFDKLRLTAGAPLEYLGKSLVYKALQEPEEEAKCLELAIRKYAHHPLLPRLIEHLIFRLHEAALHDRLAAYHFTLLALRTTPHIFTNPDHARLLSSMQKNWESIPLLHSQSPIISIAFFLARPLPLLESLDKGAFVEDALWALLQLGCAKMIHDHPLVKDFPDIQHAITKTLPQESSFNLRYFLTQEALDRGEILPEIQDQTQKIWALLISKEWDKAATLFEDYPLEELAQETSPLFPLFGCYLVATEGETIARSHFLAATETPYPRTTSLLAHFLANRIDLKKGWIDKAFLWEKMQLFRQLHLFYHCSNNPAAAKKCLNTLQQLKHVTENS
jgi:eukaryotic-like serine/threonine-protein kinase